MFRAEELKPASRHQKVSRGTTVFADAEQAPSDFIDEFELYLGSGPLTSEVGLGDCRPDPFRITSKARLDGQPLALLTACTARSLLHQRHMPAALHQVGPT